MSHTPLDLMQLHIDALFVHDADGCIDCINDWMGTRPAPRFFLGRTNEGNIWRFRQDLPSDLHEQLQALCEQEPATTARWPLHYSRYQEILAAHKTIEQIWTGPAYRISRADATDDDTVAITENNSGLLEAGLDDWLPDVPHQQPFYVATAAGRAAAVCASVRTTTLAHEAGVETLPDERRKGYAKKAVSAWASAVQQLNANALYSTSFDNVASQGLANKLGASMFGVDFHIT